MEILYEEYSNASEIAMGHFELLRSSKSPSRSKETEKKLVHEVSGQTLSCMEGNIRSNGGKYIYS